MYMTLVGLVKCNDPRGNGMRNRVHKFLCSLLEIYT